MDGSIATSASLRMRDQLRGAFQAPVDGGDAGLFEELLRMPISESLPKVEADAPVEDDDASVPATAPEASQKPDSKPEREEDAVDDGEEEASDEQALLSFDGVALVQAIPASATAVEPPPASAVEAAQAAPAQGVDHAQVVSSQTAAPNEPPLETVQTAAVVERPTQTLETTEPAAPTSEVLDTPVAVEHTIEAPASETGESNVAVDQTPIPVASVPQGNAEQSNQSPHQAAEAKPSLDTHTKTQTESPSVSSAAPAQSPLQPQTQSEPRASQTPQEQPQAQANVEVPAEASVVQADATREPEPARADEGERREKWFARDDEGSHADQSQAEAASSANENSPLSDELASPTNAADVTGGLGGSDTLDAFSQLTQADAPAGPAALDVSAMAAALTQQSGGASSATPRSDARQVSPGVGQVTGGRTMTGGPGQAAGASSGDPDQGGVAGLSQQERVRLVQRVARSFSRLGPDGGQVTLKLHPPQLGVLKMSVRIEGQSMTARLQTETAAARDAILENLPVLRERLAEQGIDVESFRVEVASERDAAANNQPQAQSQNPFSGDSAGGSRGGPRSVDYRRLGRNNSGQDNLAVPMRSSDSSGWPAHSPLERTLDIRA